MRKRFSVVAMVVIAMMMVVPAVLAASSTTVVTSNDLETEPVRQIAWIDSDKWFFYNDATDVIDNSLGSFVSGPDVAPLGAGSAQITVEGLERRNLATFQFRGTPLAEIESLAYSTYNASATNGGSATSAGYLQFNVDFTGSDTWQSRLVFLPNDNGTVLPDAWQEWDTIAGGEARWRYSGTRWPNTTISGMTPKTWSQILVEYPGVRMRVTDAFLGIRVGEPYRDGYTENIDAFKFGTSDETTVFDFEPLIGPPANKNECKDGGWQEYNNPSYTNQGECVSSIASGGKAGGKK